MSQPTPPFQTRSGTSAASAGPRPTPTAAAATVAAPAPAPAPTAPRAPAPASAAGAGAPHLDSILRIPVVVQVFLGAASMPIADLMKLGRGAVVALDHDIGDPVDVVVNGRVIARGELVALEEDPSKIGVKLTEIVGSPDAAA